MASRGVCEDAAGDQPRRKDKQIIQNTIINNDVYFLASDFAY